MVRFLLKKGANIESKDKYGWTPLINSIFLKLLFNRSYFLCIASRYGHIEVVKLLVESGANIESTDEYGLTPLMIGCFISTYYFFKFSIFLFLFIASNDGHIEVAKLLLERGASVKPIDYLCSQNALHFGIFNK